MNKEINKKLLNIYEAMFAKNGSKNWWPSHSDFETIVGAILTQFVSWKSVTTAIENLKRENMLSIEGILDAEDEKLDELIRCTRFYKQKRRRLKEFCRHVSNGYAGSLDKFFEKDKYELRNELLSLYGIGEETADSIILYAAHKPIFVVDSYTRRVFSKLGYFKDDVSYKDMQKFFMENLESDLSLFNDFHAQIDGVGSNFCSNKNPKCKECPLKKFCIGGENIG